MNQFKLIRIGWADAMSHQEGWKSLQQSLKWGRESDWIVHHVGWVLEETEDYILLAGEYTKGSLGCVDHYGSLFKIPKPWVQYREEIVDAEK